MMSFGESISDGTNTFNGIFDGPSAPGGTREGPQVRLRSSDVTLYGIVQGSTLIVRETDYTVDGLQPDGVGSTRVVLSRVP